MPRSLSGLLREPGTGTAPLVIVPELACCGRGK
jgi:hypothetical protein